MAITTAIAAAVATLTGIGVELQGAKAAANGAGEFDFSFDLEGIVETQFIPGGGEGRLVATTHGFGNRPLAAVYGNTAEMESYVARFTTNGRFDKTFGGDGRASVDLSGVVATAISSLPVDLVVDAFNRPLLLSSVADNFGNVVFVLTRFTPEGEPDLSFDQTSDPGDVDGSIIGTFPDGDLYNYANALAVDDLHGIYYVAGSTTGGADPYQPRIAKFSTDGFVSTPHIASPHPATGDAEYLDIVIDESSDRDPIAVGYIYDPAVMNATDESDALVNRFDRETGAYDSGYAVFAGNGRIENFVDGQGEHAVAVDVRDGSAAIAVASPVTTDTALLYKLDATGAPLATFNEGNPQGLAAGHRPTALHYVEQGIVVAGRYEPSGPSTDVGFVSRYAENGGLDTSFNAPVGTQTVNFGGTSDVRPSIDVDRAGRVLVGADTGDADSRVMRLTGDRADGPTAASRILFDDVDGSGARSIYGMAPDASDVVLVKDGGAGVSYQNAVANQNGIMFYEKQNGSAVDVMQANASDGSDETRLFPDSHFTGQNVRRPSVNIMTGDVHALVEMPQGWCHFSLTSYGAIGSGEDMCGLVDAAVNPVVPTVAFIRDNDIFLADSGGYNRVLLRDNVAATRLAWGNDGKTLLYDNRATPGVTSLESLTWQSADNVYNAHQPDYYPQPTAPLVVVPPIGETFTAFAVAPELSTDFPYVYSYDNNAGDRQVSMAKVDGSEQVSLFKGIDARVSAWARNFSVYPEEGPEATLEPASVAVGDVPLQSQSPASATTTSGANVEAAPLLKLPLLRSPILKLPLLRSPLLKLPLLRSPLLKLPLLRSPAFGLSALGVDDDLGGSPMVQAGLRRITLSELGILRGMTWRERLLAVGTDEATRLAGLPLQSVTLDDVLGITDFEFPQLEELDLATGPFGTISVMPFLLGDTRLHQISGIDWCGVFEARGAADCGAAYGVPGSAHKGKSASLLSLQIAGFNLDDLPSTGGNLNDLRTITYGQVAWNRDAALLPNIVVSSIDTFNASVGGALVRNITPDPAAAVYCQGAPDAPANTTPVDCGPTSSVNVHAADRANALRPDVSVFDLGGALNAFPLNELALGVWGEPGDDPYDQPPSALGISSLAGGQGTSFVMSFARVAMGAGATSSPTLAVRMPFGYEFRPGSAEFFNSSSLIDEDWMPLPEPVRSGAFIRWQVPTVLSNGDFLQVRFRASPTAPVNDQLVATIDDGYRSQMVGSEPLIATDQNEVDDPGAAPSIEPDRLYFGRIDSSTDVDYFRIPLMYDYPVVPGSTITVYLSQLRYDADLTVYHPPRSARGEPLRPASDLPGIDAIPDKAVTVTNQGEPLIGEGEADVPLLPDRAIAALSTNRGNRAERAVTLTWPAADNPDDTDGRNYLVQVSGFNGASGPETYAVRYTITPPPTLPSGTPRTGFDGPGSPEITPLPEGAPHPETLILTNPTRLARLYGADAGTVATALTQLAGDTNGQILPVDSSAFIRERYAEWDAQPNDPERANAVVRAINAEVDYFLENGHRPHLKSIIVVGTDEVIPMARLLDLTQTANERSFAQELRELAASTGGNNALLGAALAGRILSDDPFGAFSPRRFDGEWLYVPDVALGRLVETPQQIVNQINEFHLGATPEDGPGTVRPTSTLSVGADFMTLLAETIQESFNAQLPDLPASAKQTLIGNNWTRSDLSGKLGASAPSLVAINSHYSPQSLEPGSRLDTTHPDDPNLSADRMTADSDFRRRLLFTMGCHSGFNITNYFSGDTKDFPEMLAADTAGAFIGNTGFGIGVRDFNAFSQRLFDDFAALLSQADFGTALKQAKQRYLADGITNPYDYKVLAEATYFGIPQYELVGATPITVPKDENPQPNFAGGILSAPVTVNQPTDGDAWTKHTNDDGSYYSLNMPNSGHVFVPDRPVQPKRTVDVTATNPDLRAVDVFVDLLEIGGAETGFDPVLPRPQAAAGSGAEVVEARPSDLVFPFSFADVSAFTDIDGSGRQKLVVVPAQFAADGATSSGELVGAETRFAKVGVKVLYQDLADENRAVDSTKPALSLGRAVSDGQGGVDLSVAVDDPETGIVKVVALYRVGDENAFRLVELSEGDDGRYVAHLDDVDEDIEVLFQAVNEASLVGWFGNKGKLFAAAPADVITASFDREPYAQSPASFEGPVTVKFTETGPDNAELISFTINGGPEQFFPDNEIELSDFGDYTIGYRSNAGDAAGEIFVRIAEKPDEVATLIFDTAPNENDFFTTATTATVVSDDPDSVISIKVNGQDASNPVRFGDPAHPATAADGAYTIEYTTSLGSYGTETIFVDTNAPTITVTRPAADATYVLRQSVKADYECDDAFLAADGCEGTIADGASLDTASITEGTSTRQVSVTATDLAGHVATVVRKYRVAYASPAPCAGITGHTIANSTNDLDDVRTIVFSVCDADGNPVAPPEALPALGLPVEVNADGSLGNPALGACKPLLGIIKFCLLPLLQPRQTAWKSVAGTWRFTQDMTQLAPGRHRFRVFLRDGTHMDYTVRKVVSRYAGF